MKQTKLTALTVLGLFASAVPIHAAVIAPPVTVPEGGQTLLLLAVAMVTVVAVRCKLAK